MFLENSTTAEMRVLHCSLHSKISLNNIENELQYRIKKSERY